MNEIYINTVDHCNNNYAGCLVVVMVVSYVMLVVW